MSAPRLLAADLFKHPVPPNIEWRAMERFLIHIGATVDTKVGGRITVVWRGKQNRWNRQQPCRYVERSTLVAIGNWLATLGLTL